MGGRIQKVEVVANIASGGVADDAPATAEKILADFGLAGRVCATEAGDLTRCVQAAIDASPDLLVILAGDGTARTAVQLSGADGPLIAPLPGGTMNMLPKAIYGPRSWQDALTAALSEGEAQPLAGGEVEGRIFLVAAILGAPALWAPAREAVREGRLLLAVRRGRHALRRAFSGRLRYAFEGGPRRKAEALTFMCPVASRALEDEEQVLEGAALDPSGAAEAFRLGVNAIVRDWRDDPAVTVRRLRQARVWASGPIPALLDGELFRLRSTAEVRFKPDVARVLALPKDTP